MFIKVRSMWQFFFIGLWIFYCKHHKHEHPLTIHVPELVDDFVSTYHKRLDRMNGNDDVVDRIYRPLLLSLLLDHLNHLDQYYLMHWKLILRLYRMVLCIHSKNLLHDLYPEPNMMDVLYLWSSLDRRKKYILSGRFTVKL